MAKKRTPADDQPVSDVYVGLLAISLLAQIVGIVFLVLDYNALKSSPLPKLEKFTWSVTIIGHHLSGGFVYDGHFTLP